MPTKQKSSGDISDVTGNGKPAEAPTAEPKSSAKTPPALPTTKTKSSGELEHKMVVIYGPPGVGKTTLASEWAGGNVFFFNCAGELGDIEVYQQPIQSWPEFREYAWSVSETAKKGNLPFGASAIDTADVLGRYCSEVVRKRLGIVHESDLDWGKGWSSLRDEFHVNVAKLAAIPNHGILFVAHADEREVKTRSATYDKWQIRGVKGISQTMLDMADLVLFLNFGEDDDSRVIKTKPSRYWDAKERGTKPRLPAEIPWPIGENGWDIVKAAWDKGGE
jgi:DNA polymerase III delta prime subunit